MTYFDFLSSIDDDSIKKKRKILIGKMAWNIGRMDGGAHGACDKYQERFVILVPSKQKPSVGPRLELTLFLRKKDGSNQMAQSDVDPLMLSLSRHKTEKYGCKRLYSHAESWDCQTHLVGELCEIGEPNFEAIIDSLNIEKMVLEVEQLADEVSAAEPYISGKPADYNFIRLQNLNSFFN